MIDRVDRKETYDMDERFVKPYSDPRWWWDGTYTPVCFHCAHFRGASEGKIRCLHFRMGSLLNWGRKVLSIMNHTPEIMGFGSNNTRKDRVGYLFHNWKNYKNMRELCIDPLIAV